MAHWNGAQGQAKMAKITQNTPACDVPPRKAQTTNKNFFSSLTTRLFASLEGFNSSLALAAGDLWPKRCWPRSWPFRDVKGQGERRFS